MSSISVSTDTKSEFDELKPEDMTHDDFVGELLDAYQRDNGQVVDPEAIVEQITHQTASEVELAAYRGIKEGLEKHG